MAGLRGAQQRGRTGNFPADRKVRAAVMLEPGDPLRGKYEALVSALGVSGAEVIRIALQHLELDEHGRPVGRAYTQGVIAEAS